MDDPARAQGTEAEVMAVFRTSRDAIRERIADLIGRLEAGNDEGEET